MSSAGHTRKAGGTPLRFFCKRALQFRDCHALRRQNLKQSANLDLEHKAVKGNIDRTDELINQIVHPERVGDLIQPSTLWPRPSMQF